MHRFVAIGALAAALIAPTAVHASDRQDVGSATVLPTDARTLGAASDAAPVDLRIVLHPRDPAGMERLATAVSTPGDPRYGQFLARGEFGERFAPDAASVGAVRSALESAGLETTGLETNSLVLHATGTVAQAEAAFATSLQQVRVDGVTALADSGTPSLPSGVAGAVDAVLGLDTIPMGAPNHDAAAHAATASSDVSTSAAGEPCAAASAAATSNGAYTMDQLGQAYDFTRVRQAGGRGAGVTVGVLEWEPLYLSDIDTFKACYGSSANVTTVNVNGGPTFAVNDSEATLDVETIAALAPQSDILIYQGPSASGQPTDAEWVDVFQQAASDRRADVLSTSWGQCEPDFANSVATAWHNLLVQMALQGQTVFAAAGDDGSEDCNGDGNSWASDLRVDLPGSDPYITAVGGTTLTAVGSSPSVAPTEQVWNTGSSGGAGGGGVSIKYAMPDWQHALRVTDPAYAKTGTYCVQSTGTYCRQVPDVSALANWDQGYIFFYTGSGWYEDGGTSAASPLWAAMATSILSTPQCAGKRFGLLNPALYQLAARSDSGAFNDITVGHNDLLNLYSGTYPATVGYDMASGLGSPIGGGLLNGLCPAAPAPTPSGGGVSTPTTPAATPATAPVPAPTPAPVPIAPAAPVPTAPVRVQVKDATLALKGGVATLPLSCPVSAIGGCSVDLRLRGDGVDLLLRGRHIAAGGQRGFALRLPAKRVAKLRRAGVRQVALRLMLTTRTAGGTEATTTRWVVVRVPRR